MVKGMIRNRGIVDRSPQFTVVVSGKEICLNAAFCL